MCLLDAYYTLVKLNLNMLPQACHKMVSGVPKMEKRTTEKQGVIFLYTLTSYRASHNNSQ